MMKYSFQYGDRVLTLPAAVLSRASATATALDWRVLCALAADYRLYEDGTVGAAELAKTLDLTESEVLAALAFWRGAGVLVQDEAGESTKKQAQARVTPEKKPLPDRGLPTYSTADLAGIAEGRADFGALIGACQQTFGKVFNTAEIAIVAGLVDYLGLEGDYVLLLLSHCVRMEKKSLRYAEKMALSLYDDGITDAVALEERLQRVETMAGAVGKIRTMFGMGSRAFTAKERSMVERWVCGMRYEMDVINLAYDATVNATGKPALSYANTILERWYAAGYRTTEDVTRAMEEYRRKKQGDSSFDADEVFQAMLKKTYGEI